MRMSKGIALQCCMPMWQACKANMFAGHVKEHPHDFTLVSQPDPGSPWDTYLSQVDRVLPYLGQLARWVETLSGPSAR